MKNNMRVKLSSGLLKFVATVSFSIAVLSANSRCWFYFGEEKEPANVDKLKRIN